MRMKGKWCVDMGILNRIFKQPHDKALNDEIKEKPIPDTDGQKYEERRESARSDNGNTGEQLHIGMSFDEIVELLGDPAGVNPGTDHVVRASELTGEMLAGTMYCKWERPEGTYLLVVEAGRLARIHKTPTPIRTAEAAPDETDELRRGKLVRFFGMKEERLLTSIFPNGAAAIEHYACDHLSWDDVWDRLVPFMQTGDFEPLDAYFIEAKPGGWKKPSGVVHWTRGAWISRSEHLIVIRGGDSLTLRRFASLEDLEVEVHAIQAWLGSR
jgi:hypothetical protein